MPDESSISHSVTSWIDNLKDGSSTAAEQLWSRYFTRLVQQAGRQLGNAPRRIADEEDVAINVFQSLCAGSAEGRFSQLKNRDDLWKLLVVMTRLKSCNQVRHQVAKKRGGKNLRGHSILGIGVGDQLSTPDASFDQFLGQDPTPEFLLEMQEQQDLLMGKLADGIQRKIAELRLQGFTNDEIAQAVGISVRSVERKLNLLRKIWLLALDEAV